MTRRSLAKFLGAALLFSIGLVSASSAQEQGAAAASQPGGAAPTYESSSLAGAAPGANAVQKSAEGKRMGLIGRFVGDQRGAWVSPGHVRFSDMDWLVPLGGVAAGLFVADRQFSKHLSQSPTTLSHYKTLSNVGAAALIGAGAGMWLLSYPKHKEHWRETGFLAGEAALNSLVAVESLKYSLRRERPFQGDGGGHFFQSGGTSFPSEHAAAAWSVAGVIAHEYPGTLTKFLAYGLASAESAACGRGREASARACSAKRARRWTKKAQAAPKRRRSFVSWRRNSTTRWKARREREISAGEWSRCTRVWRAFPASHSPTAITSGRRSSTITAGRTRRESTPPMASPRGRRPAAGWATCGANISTRRRRPRCRPPRANSLLPPMGYRRHLRSRRCLV